MAIIDRVLSLYSWLNWKINKFSKPIKLSIQKRKFASCGENIDIYGKPKICFANRIRLGKNVSLNDGCVLNATESSIEIGDNCTISSYAQILAATYDVDGFLREHNTHHISNPIIIGDNVWVCSGAIICPGVHIVGGNNWVLEPS